MFSNYNLGEQFNQSDYTSNHIDGEEFISATGAANEVFSLAWTPVIPNTITLLYNDVEYTDNGQGQITIPGNVLNIDYREGKVVATNALAVGTTLSFTYDYNNLDVPVAAPEIKIRIVTSPIQAKSRKLKTLYSFDKLQTVA